MRRAVVLALRALTLVGLGACAGAPLPPPPDGTVLLADLGADEFPGAAALLPGIEPLAADREWRDGDEVLFGLRLRDGDTVRRWLLHVQIEDAEMPLSTWIAERFLGVPVSPSSTVSFVLTGDKGDPPPQYRFSTRIAGVRLRVHDADGAQLGNSRAELGRDALAAGLLPPSRGLLGQDLAQRAAALPGLRSGFQSLESYAAPMASLILIGSLLQDDPVLSPILWRVADKPVLAVLFGMGINLGLDPRFEEVALSTADRMPIHRYAPGWLLPVRATVNGAPVLDSILLVTAANAPVSLAGGLLGFEAWRPGREDLRLSAVLLGARRGGQ